MATLELLFSFVYVTAASDSSFLLSSFLLALALPFDTICKSSIVVFDAISTSPLAEITPSFPILIEEVLFSCTIAAVTPIPKYCDKSNLTSVDPSSPFIPKNPFIPVVRAEVKLLKSLFSNTVVFKNFDVPIELLVIISLSVTKFSEDMFTFFPSPFVVIFPSISISDELL